MTAGAAGRFRKQVGQGDLVAIQEDKITRWADNLHEGRYAEQLQYWTDYRLVPSLVLEDLGVGWHPQKRRYTIPVRDARGRCVDVKLYRPNEKDFGKSLHYTEKSEGEVMAWGKPPRLWGLDRVAAASVGKGRAGVVVLCAGEPDALVATALGYLAVSPTSGEGALCREQDAQVLLAGGWPVRLVFDVDKAGRAAAGVWARALLEFGISNVKDVQLDFPNGDGKDLSEWVRLDEWARTGDYADAGDALWATIRATARLDIGDLDNSGSGSAGTSGDNSGGPQHGGRSSDNGGGDNGHAGVPEDRRPIAELIEMALVGELIRTGSRNRAGFWLWCQMRDERYAKNEAIAVVDEWVQAANAAVPAAGHSYTNDESRLSLDQAYSSPAREKNGQGLSYPMTDLGNSERLVHQHGMHMMYLPADDRWAAWNGRQWDKEAAFGMVHEWAYLVPRMMHEEGAKALRQAKAAGLDKDDERFQKASKLMGWARASESAGKLAAMLNLAKTKVAESSGALDANWDLLNLRNGTVELGGPRPVFREHQREDLLTFCAPVQYEVGAQRPEFDKFLKEVLPDEDVREYVQRLVGYSLLGGNKERWFVFIVGPSASGKSTLSNILQGILGEYSTPFKLSVMREKQESGHRQDIIDVISKRIIFASEASDAWCLHADQVKNLTGHEAVVARAAYGKTTVTRYPAFTPWLMTNAIPQIKGADDATKRRLIAVPFEISRAPGTENTGLGDDIIRMEGPGVLAWALDGVEKFRRRGLNDMPLPVALATDTLRNELTDFDLWINECCDYGPEYTAFTHVLHQNYLNWCMTNSIHERDVMNIRSFGKTLAGRAGIGRGPKVRYQGSTPQATWSGIRVAVHQEEVRS